MVVLPEGITEQAKQEVFYNLYIPAMEAIRKETVELLIRRGDRSFADRHPNPDGLTWEELTRRLAFVVGGDGEAGFIKNIEKKTEDLQRRNAINLKTPCSLTSGTAPNDVQDGHKDLKRLVKKLDFVNQKAEDAPNYNENSDTKINHFLTTQCSTKKMGPAKVRMVRLVYAHEIPCHAFSERNNVHGFSRTGMYTKGLGAVPEATMKQCVSWGRLREDERQAYLDAVEPLVVRLWERKGLLLEKDIKEELPNADIRLSRDEKRTTNALARITTSEGHMQHQAAIIATRRKAEEQKELIKYLKELDAEDKAAEVKEKKRLNLLKKLVREATQKLKAEEKAAKRAEQEKAGHFFCLDPQCSAHCSPTGGKHWLQCEHCNDWMCKKHAQDVDQHEKSCKEMLEK
jgi:hypothetical protein